MTVRRAPLAGLPLALLVVLLLVASVAPAGQAAPSARDARWAPAATATIHPGAQMLTKGAQCTGNFVLADRRGRVYVGYAAHCAGLGEATDTDGCATGSHPLGTRVAFVEGMDPAQAGEVVGHGRLAYSSWLTMQQRGTTDADACAANDFALVRVSRGDRGEVNPSVPFWGGPTGLSSAGAAAGSSVYSYGGSSLRPTTLLSPKAGLSLGRTYGGWGWDVYTASPGIPGDSGSGFLDADGAGFGTLSTVAVAPLAGSNGLGDLRREIAFAREHAGIAGLHLVRGTEPFAAVPGL
ncbi:hypothetical protein [Nocardioides taihuensis]|uniref:Serine protease n=1 Tax=Nocardioides taihuensis TaxID=1835606 RepID=A0ABW0BLX0_9ACTN